MALGFSGTGRVSFGSMNPGNVLSYAAWARSPGTANDALIDWNSIASFWFDASNVITFETATALWTGDMTGITVTNWNHYAVTYDGNNGTTPDPVFYINGAVVTTTEANPPEAGITAASATLTCGNFNSGSGPIEGFVSECMVFGAILDQTGINSAMNGTPPMTNLHRYAPLYGTGGTDYELVTGTAATVTGTPVKGEHSPNHIYGTGWPDVDNQVDTYPQINRQRRGMPMWTGPGTDFIMGIQERGGRAFTFPMSPIIDTAARADESPAVGWTDSPDGTSYGGIKILSNQLASVSGDSYDYWTTPSFGPDCEAYVTVPVTGNVSLYARLNPVGSAAVDGYEVQIVPGSSGVNIRRLDNNTPTLLGSSITQAFSAGDSFGIRCFGNEITAWYKASGGLWTLIGTRTDTTYNQAGFLGFFLPVNTIRLTNVGGGSI